MSKEMKVGIVFVIGMIILAGLTFYAGGFDDWLKKRYKIRAYFEKVDGLQREDIVTLAGVEVVEVKDMRVKQDRVEVILLIDGDTVLHRDSVARIESESLLGGKYVSITVGTPGSARLNDGDLIQTEEAADLAKILQNVADVAQDLLTMVASFNKNQEKIAGQIQDVLGENRENIRSSFEALARITTENEQGIKEAIASLREAGPKLNQTMDSINKIAAKIERGEGTIGKLVQDETLYKETTRMLKEARHAAEDVREQVPIITFTSVIFAAFQ
ncbi:MAG: MCE family protein [Candidatus Lindowbacteria bacterium]|nr:MCE family protein [Candidatus Lindowbacteria bacterium]